MINAEIARSLTNAFRVVGPSDEPCMDGIFEQTLDLITMKASNGIGSLNQTFSDRTRESMESLRDPIGS